MKKQVFQAWHECRVSRLHTLDELRLLFSFACQVEDSEQVRPAEEPAQAVPGLQERPGGQSEKE